MVWEGDSQTQHKPACGPGFRLVNLFKVALDVNLGAGAVKVGIHKEVEDTFLSAEMDISPSVITGLRLMTQPIRQPHM